MATRILLLALSAPLISTTLCSATLEKESSKSYDKDVDEDLKYIIEEEEKYEASFVRKPNPEEAEHVHEDHADHEENSPSPFEEKDVMVLNEGNFTDYVEKNRYVMVEFYAPWCGHCQVLVPEYAAAARELKGEAVLAKVDVTVSNNLE
ncbi:hypothetical protein GIB67_014642 [Kingdonia uniflora]|uniref:Thioredoxin domain-containing protein n=1 Tax=Kingdonia uniflora TaxID=39325 RepID=A0A7J7NVN9_9MAGN|nr:hypothetical protein GIB67_014642 [Kingdonia uniflora]